MTQTAVGEHAPTTTHCSGAGEVDGGECLVDEHVDNRLLHRRGHILQRGQVTRIPGLVDEPGHCGLQTREREVVGLIGERSGEGDGSRVTVGRRLVYRRSPGEPETHHTGELVEGLPGRVVDRLAQRLVFTPVGHMDDLGMPSGRQQGDCRRGEVLELNPWGHQVALHVVDPDERELTRPGRGLGEGMADQQCPHQPRACGGGDTVEVRRMHPGLGERLVCE